VSPVRRLLSLTVVVAGGVALLSALAVTALEPTQGAAAEVDFDHLTGADKVNAIISRVVEKQRSVSSLQADFTQVKQSDLLLEDMESQGRFSYLAPDHVRWDYLQPAGMVVAFSNDMVTTYYPNRKKAESIKISRRNRRFVRVMAGTQPLDDLAANFSITLSDAGSPTPYRLTLEPVKRVLRRKLRQVILEVDRELLLPITVEYHAADGDCTRYEFHNLVINPRLEPADFDLNLGEEVQIEVVDMSTGTG
jgi:outer membrane lipoprotein carrier protein